MDEIKKILARVVLGMLTPIIRILLRFEVSHSEFSELAKRAYVRVAYRYFTIPKRKQTYSRVSVITGIPRKEVVRITETDLEEPPVTKGPLNRATQVITGWVRDPQFLDAQGEPRDLFLKGQTPSFEQLVEKYSGDITARAILDELVRVGAVEKKDNNTVSLLSKGYVPKTSEAEKLEMLARHFTDLMTTGAHNITHSPQDARFQRQVSYSDLPQSVIDEFKAYSQEKSLELLIDFDRWLAEKKKNIPPDENEPVNRVGIGIYFIEDEKEEGENHGNAKKS
jgi:hypothetical protein